MKPTPKKKKPPIAVPEAVRVVFPDFAREVDSLHAPQAKGGRNRWKGTTKAQRSAEAKRVRSFGTRRKASA